ncbi:hypothetical protein Clacol_002916 [Clathrus columnatus]|uniref:LsmAD domain-containing protein n=1 Tax=Clathrus columnatus TaxID=1419009 RepID=A0AAV5A5E0_9AGAM|nr:hypothetical protein Clacol_002916 [Clathrus columnatus]
MSAAIRNNKNTGATRKTTSGLQDNNPPRRAPAWRGNSHPASVYAPPPSTNAKYQQPTPSQFPPLGNNISTGSSSPNPNPASPPPAASSTHSLPSSSTLSVSASAAAPDTPLPPPTLIGQSIIITTRTGQRYQGALVAVPPAADAEAVIVLKDVRDLASSTPNHVTKDNFNLAVGSIVHWSNPSSANGLKMSLNGNSNEFRTDGDISQTGNASVRRFINNASGATSGSEGRDLQAWQPDATTSYSGSGFPAHSHLRGDEATFGPGAAPPNGSWDQFAANERMFGVKTSFNEELYTTKLDRNTPDFKERERKAMAIAQEIMSSGTSNPHVAEERNIIVDDSGVNEEDKYAGVIRGANAYVPPARRGQQQSQPANPSQNQPETPKQGVPSSPEVPKVSVSSDGASTTTPAPTVPMASGGTSPTPTPSPSASANASSPSNRPPADLTSTFRDFVAGEKQRLTQKRAAIVKSEMDKRMSELVKFSKDFKLNKPIPEDLLNILAKDESKQQQIREKAAKDAANAAARAITGTAAGGTGVGIGAGPRVVVPVGAAVNSVKKAGGTGAGVNGPTHATPSALNNFSSGASTAAVSASTSPAIANATSAATTLVSNATNTNTSTSTIVNVAKRTRITMVIPPIPPFNPNKLRVATTQADKEKENGAVAPNGTDTSSTGDSAALTGPLPKLNVNAPAFRLKPGAPPFKPSTPINTSAPSLPPISSPAPSNQASSSVSPANAFFGTRVIKKGAVVHVKDDFNPFKTGIVGGKNGDAASVSFNWPYSGKRFMLLFPNLPPPPSTATTTVPPTVQLHHPPHAHSHAPMSPGAPMMPLNMGMMGGMSIPPGAVPNMPGVSGMNMGVTLIPPGTPNLAGASVSTAGAPNNTNGGPGTSATGVVSSAGQGPTTPGAPPGSVVGIPNQQPPTLPPGGAAPPNGPPGPPPSYEDDQHRAAVAAAAAYGMVYYPPYGYHGQPLLPPGAPGSYIPSHYLPPMHYPHMPPNGHPIYAHAPPPMGGIPPQQYMQHPPPGAYPPPPPPPNAAGRGSMPPTPMQHHAHPYYHSSPQISHAVPYSMMMPPPHGTGSPAAPPHPYDTAHNAPPQQVPMGHS